MAKTYRLYLTETVNYYHDIEAESEEEAREAWDKAWNSGEITTDYLQEGSDYSIEVDEVEALEN